MTVQCKSIYQGTVVDLNIETIQLPNGRTVSLEIVRHPGGAAVVALDPDHRVCMLRQYRHAAGGWIWELPAGKLDPGESPLETARRELEEEAGLRADTWQTLGRMVSTPGFCDEIIHLFLAQSLTKVAARTEAHELLECHWIPWVQVSDWALDGTLIDAKSIIGLHLARSALDTSHRGPS